MPASRRARAARARRSARSLGAGSRARLAYLTGKRKGQLRKLEVHNVRVQAGKVTALVWEQRKVKNRRPDVLPLTGRAQTLMQRLWEARGARRPALPHRREAPW